MRSRQKLLQSYIRAIISEGNDREYALPDAGVAYDDDWVKEMPGDNGEMIPDREDFGIEQLAIDDPDACEDFIEVATADGNDPNEYRFEYQSWLSDEYDDGGSQLVAIGPNDHAYVWDASISAWDSYVD